MNESTILFPLRTNVDYFQSRQGCLDLQSRVKQSLILFDRIVFQAGDFRCHIMKGGVFERYLPDVKGGEQQALQFEEDEKGADRFSLRIRRTGAAPADPFTSLIDGPIERSFRSQFHTPVGEIKANGIEEVELRYLELSEEEKRYASRISRAERDRLKVDAGNRSLRNTIVK